MIAHPDAAVAALRVEPGMKVADFGAGQGAHMEAFSASVGPSGRVYLVDVQKPLVDRLAKLAQRAGFSNVDPIWADVEVPRATSLADASLDRVLLSHVLFQTEDRAATLAEAFRVLKPGGRLLVVEWAAGAPAATLHGERMIDPPALAALVTAAGFASPEPVSVGAAQHALAAAKN